MRKLIILLALAACCLAAPSHLEALPRPSPINPDIPSDPRPPERITMITDPKEIEKHKRESGSNSQPEKCDVDSMLPTVPPTSTTTTTNGQQTEEVPDQLHRQKRDNAASKPSSVKQEKSPSAPSEPAKGPSSTRSPPVAKHAASTKPTAKTRTTKKTNQNRKNKNISGSSTPAPSKSSTPSAAPQQPAAAKLRRKRDESSTGLATAEPTPLVYRDQHKTPLASSYAEHTSHLNLHQVGDEQTYQGLRGDIEARPPSYVVAQTLPALNLALQADTHPVASTAAIASTSTLTSTSTSTTPGTFHFESHASAKRDIPVPLVAKHHHPEKSPDSSEEQSKPEKPKDDNSDDKDHKDHKELKKIGESEESKKENPEEDKKTEKIQIKREDAQRDRDGTATVVTDGAQVLHLQQQPHDWYLNGQEDAKDKETHKREDAEKSADTVPGVTGNWHEHQQHQQQQQNHQLNLPNQQPHEFHHHLEQPYPVPVAGLIARPQHESLAPAPIASNY